MSGKIVRGGIAGLATTIAAVGSALLPGVAEAASDTTAPATPSNLRVQNVSPTSATFTWSPSTDNSGWVMYEVEASALPSSLQRFGATEPSKTVTGLEPGLTYTASVVAVDSAQNRSAPVSVQFSTSVDATPPTTPTNLRAATVNGAVDSISWGASADSSAVTYVLFSGANRIFGTTKTSVTAHELLYLDCVVAPGSTHTLTVQARDAFDNVSGRSGPITVTFPK
jgi:hypothetical protein